MDLNKIIQEIKLELSKRNSSIPKLNQSNDFNQELENSYFQNPIKGEYKNIGDFGVVNETHPNGHQGIDIQAPKGTNMYPIAPGKVTRVAFESKGGNAVYIQHANGYRSFYTHLDSTYVKVGDVVGYDTAIGTVGNTGNAKNTSAHLHLQVWKDGKIINPATLFNFKKYNT